MLTVLELIGCPLFFGGVGEVAKINKIKNKFGQ